MHSLTGPAAPQYPGDGLAIIIDSTAEEVRTALLRVAEALCRCGLCRGACGTVEIVLAEALNNIVEHAYAGPVRGPIRILLRPQGGTLRIELRDRGQPMPGLVLPEGRQGPLAGAAELPEGGFGWSLIHLLSAQVSYRRDPGENVLEILVHTRGDAGLPCRQNRS